MLWKIEGWNREPTLPPWEDQDKRQHKSHVSLDSRTDNKYGATNKWRRTPDRTKLGEDLRQHSAPRGDLRAKLNAKWNEGGDLHAKLNVRRATVISKVVPTGSMLRTTHSK